MELNLIVINSYIIVLSNKTSKNYNLSPKFILFLPLFENEVLCMFDNRCDMNNDHASSIHVIKRHHLWGHQCFYKFISVLNKMSLENISIEIDSQ